MRSLVPALLLMTWTLSGQTMQVSFSKQPEKVKAMFADARVSPFLKAVKDAFGTTCTLPDADNTAVKVSFPVLEPSAPPDAAGFAPSFYEVSLTCAGNTQVAEVTIKGEFAPLLGGPLKLALSVALVAPKK